MARDKNMPEPYFGGGGLWDIMPGFWPSGGGNNPGPRGGDVGGGNQYGCIDSL